MFSTSGTPAKHTFGEIGIVESVLLSLGLAGGLSGGVARPLTTPLRNTAVGDEWMGGWVDNKCGHCLLKQRTQPPDFPEALKEKRKKQTLSNL